MSNKYNENSISELSQIEGARLRPQSIGFESHTHIFTEQLANAIDEAREGYGNTIEIEKYNDNSISVRDYGRSIPLDYNEKTQKYNWESIFLRMWAGGKYSNNKDGANYKLSLGTNGAGNFGSATTSEFLEVWSYKGKECHNIRFEQGKVIKEFNKFKSDIEIGTKTHFKPDIEVYGENEIPNEFIEDMLKRQSIVNGGIKFVFKNIKDDYQKTFFYENGISDYIKEISESKEITDFYSFEGETFIESKPQNFQAKYKIDFTFNNNINLMEYYHNASYLPNGGLPEKVIKNSMLSVIDKFISSNNLYKKNEKIKFEDIQDSLIIIFSSGSTTSIFTDQTKKSIGHKVLQDHITDAFKSYLEILFTEDKLLTQTVCNQVLVNMKARTNAEKTKLDIKSKLSNTNKKGLTPKIEGLKHCNFRKSKLEERILLLDEGISANSTITEAFDNRIMGAYGLRGRFINSLKCSVSDVLNNIPALGIINALGCGIEIPKEERKKFKDIKTFNNDDSNYWSVGILCDADCFGAGISLSLITFFKKFMPTLLKQGRIYLVISPRFEIELKNGNSIYAYNENDKINKIKDIGEKNIKAITIRKGLGEYNKNEFYNLVLSEEAREKSFIQIQYNENEEELINQYFDILMGENIEGRKQFIKDNILNIDLNEVE